MRDRTKEIGRRVLEHPPALARRVAIPAFDQEDMSLMTEVVRLQIMPRDGNQHRMWATETTRGLLDVIANSRLTGHLALITGPSGVGKTTAAKAAVKAAVDADATDGAEDPTVVFASMTRAAAGLQAGLLLIGREAGVSVAAHMGASEILDALVQHAWAPASLLVLDEMQFASADLLHAIRNLWDGREQRGRPLCIVLVGTPDLTDKIKGKGRKAVEFEAFRGRLGAIVEIPDLEPGDCIAICRHYSITDKASEALVRRAAAKPGRLHNVSRLLAQTPLVAGKGVTFADLKQAAELTGVAS